MPKTFTAATPVYESMNEVLRQLEETNSRVRAVTDHVAGEPDRGVLSAMNRSMAIQGAGVDGPQSIERAFFGERQNDPVAKKMGDWIRCIALSPPGGAHQHQLALKDDVLKRVLSSQDEAGGYLIPPGFIPRLISDPQRLSQLFQWVTKFDGVGPTGQIPRVGTNCEIFWGTENADIDESDPAFDNEEWALNRMNAISKMSRELFADSGINIADVVIGLFTMCINEERDKVIAIGSGTGRPLGLYSAEGITNVTVTSLTYENLVDLKYSVDLRYHTRPAFRWHFNTAVFKKILKLKDDNGRPLFAESPIVGHPPTILGVPFSICDSFPNNYIGIGDLSYYFWFNGHYIAVERSTEAGDAYRKHQVWLKVTERADGLPVLPPTSPLARSTVLAGIS